MIIILLTSIYKQFNNELLINSLLFSIIFKTKFIFDFEKILFYFLKFKTFLLFIIHII